MKTMVGFFAAITVAIIVLPVPAAAQGINLMIPQRQETEAEKERRLEQEKAYEEQLRRIPDQKASDPWGKVRKVDAPPAKKKRQQTEPK